MGPVFVPVTIHAIIGSEDIIDAMDLRAFGVGPRTWTGSVGAQYSDRVLIWFGVRSWLFRLHWAIWDMENSGCQKH